MSPVTKAAATAAKAVAANIAKNAATVKATQTAAAQTAAKTSSTVSKAAASTAKVVTAQAQATLAAAGYTPAQISALQEQYGGRIGANTAESIAKNVMPAVTQAVQAAGQAAQSAVTRAAAVQTAVTQAAQTAGEMTQNAINEAEAVKAAVARAAQAVWNMAAKIAEGIGGVIKGVKAEPGTDISNITGEAGGEIGTHGGGSIWDDILDWLTYFLIQPLLLWVADLINGLIILTSSFRRFFYSVSSFTGRLIDKFIDTVSAAWSNAWEMVVDTSKVIYDYIEGVVFDIGQIIDAKIEEAKGWIEDVKVEIKEWFITTWHILTDPYINIWLWLKNNWPGVHTLLSDPVEFIKVAFENFKYYITAIIFTPLLELIDDLWGD